MYKNDIIHNFIKFIFPNYNYYKNNNGSEILGFLDFLPFSLPELTTSPTICCIVVRSGCKTASETEQGPCPPNCKLTAESAIESASSGSVEVSVKTDRQFIL